MDFPLYPHCKNCGVEFGARRKTAEFCSGNCRTKWHRKYKKSNVGSITPTESRRMTKSLRVESVICEGCHATFFVNGNNKQRKYHSNACKQKAYRFRCSLVKQWLR